MTKAYLTLIKKVLKKDLTISVWDSEEWQLKRSTKYQDIKEAIESVDVSEIRIRNKEGDIVGWALIVLDCEPDCTVADYSYNKLMVELNGDIWEE